MFRTSVFRFRTSDFGLRTSTVVARSPSWSAVVTRSLEVDASSESRERDENSEIRNTKVIKCFKFFFEFEPLSFLETCMFPVETNRELY